MIVGSFGEFVFQSGGVTFDTHNQARNARLASHATIEGAPVVEFLGLDSSVVTLTGTLTSQFNGDLDEVVRSLYALQDGKPRALTRGRRCYGLFLVQNLTISEDAWTGDELASATWSMQLISCRQ